MKLCQGVQYGDYKGKIFADRQDLIISVLEEIKTAKNIECNGKIIGLQFFNGNFKLVESLNKGLEVKRYDINLTFDELFSYFKRFNFCITTEDYLDKDIIL